MRMKVIRITFDEALLDKLDLHTLVRERGRSAILREAVAEYLKRQDAEHVTCRYRAGYHDRPDPNDELEGWMGEGIWPER